MSLTDLWKKGELQEGFYYVKCSWNEDVEIRYIHNNSEDEWEEIIAPVPTYEELQELESDRLAKIEGEEIVAELIETNDSLSRQVKHLLDLQANQDKEVERLRELLKECKNIVAHDLWARAQFPDGQVVEKDDLLTRINTAIREREE